jgi:rod shape-determining protein MreC
MAWRSARVALVVCLVAALLVFLADLRGAAPTQVLRGTVGAVTGPVEQGLAWVRTEVGERVGGSADERARIERLEAELAEARAAAAAAAAGQLDAAEARELAAAAPDAGYRSVPARVVARATPQDRVRSVTISAGSRDGVAAGMAVVGVRGLAGVVDSVAPRVATVRLVIDAATALPVRVASSGERGVLRGTGTAAAATLLDPLGEMAVGDLVVTLGAADASIPADLPIGRISALTGSAADLTRQAQVAPAVDDSTLDRLLVLVPEDVS